MIANPTQPSTPAAQVKRSATLRRRRLFNAKNAPRLLLLPSFILLGIFVYGFIGYTVVVSFSKWQGLGQNLNPTSPLTQNFTDLAGSTRFQSDIRNMIVFTVLFLIAATVAGMVLALLVDRVVIGKGFFRTLFLFPYSLSFVVTGVVWRWLFNPESGVNMLFNVTGVNSALHNAGMPELRPGWLTDPTVLAPLNGALESVFPALAEVKTQFGIPAALIPIVIAASWQFAGFAMAMYLAGLGSIPEETREASRVDGASGWQALRHITLPLLRPTTVSILVILGFTSLKIFDLVFVMSGSGPGFATDMPGIYIYEQMFGGLNYNSAAAAAVVMLIIIAVIAVPYLLRTYRKDKV